MSSDPTQDRINERAGRRMQLISYAREQRDLAHLQLDETYMERHTETTRQRHAFASIAHSLAAITSLMLADKEVTP